MPYHIEIISKKLTHRLTNIIPTVVEEITLAFDENAKVGSGLYCIRLPLLYDINCFLKNG